MLFFPRIVPQDEPACILCQVTTPCNTKGRDQIKTLAKTKAP